MVNWNTFESDLSNYFESYIAQNEDDASEFITNKYIQHIVGDGSDFIFKNNIVKYNKSLLENALKSIFNTSKQSNQYIFPISNCVNCSGQTICPVCGSNILSQGVIGFWVSGKLAFKRPPPGTSGIVSNDVIFPGAPTVLRIQLSQSFQQFATDLTSFFRRHLLTVNGLTTALVPTPTGPIPAPFPWQGYG